VKEPGVRNERVRMRSDGEGWRSEGWRRGNMRRGVRGGRVRSVEEWGVE